jgi:predicted amidohydrolase
MSRRALIVLCIFVAVFVHPARAADDRPATVKVACVQCSSDLGDVAGNRAKLIKLVEEAAGNGAKIIVLPEAAITGYLSQELRTTWHVRGWPIDPTFEGKDPTGFAESVPGESTNQFCAVAKRRGVYVTIPLVEIDQKVPEATPRFFNTVCLAAPDGKLVAHYRKLTPWPYPEQSWATKGDLGVATYDTEYGRVGLAICYDIHTILEKYRPKKIWALLYPIAWVDGEHPAEWFGHKLPARVAKFEHYVIGANWSVDKPQDWRGYGFSTIISPSGEVVATTKKLYGSEIVYAEIKTAWAKK